jgi:hypothetical protein
MKGSSPTVREGALTRVDALPNRRATALYSRFPAVGTSFTFGSN